MDNQPALDWTHWREHREVIRAGLRFTLPGAVHALQWTLITGGHIRPGTVNLHCTLGISNADSATIDALEKFVSEWRQELEAGEQRLQQQRTAKSAAVCESYASSGFG